MKDSQINKDLLIKTTVNASLCEIRAWIKPGNVHRTRDFPKTKYDDFLKAANALANDWTDLFYKIPYSKHSLISPSTIYSDFLMSAVNHVNSVQKGGNVLLGHLLLMTPLFISAKYGLENRFPNRDAFWKYCGKIISDSSHSDTIRLFRAIRMANPGGMGKVDKYDIYDKKSLYQIKKDKVTLLKIFTLSEDRDLISKCLATNYEPIRKDYLVRMNKLIDEYPEEYDKMVAILKRRYIRRDLIKISPKFNELIIRLFLYILSKQPDTLIIRKKGEEAAVKISTKAKELYDSYYTLENTVWFSELEKFDEQLHEEDGKLNPGTTADILATCIYLNLVYEILGLK
ncbi:MAG: hypothetical protein GF364_03650 [Candidatus Lokiarchaeota archaeon]|nr:hypothetical protein [Candidatus Lokiarchaeota archaeon]